MKLPALAAAALLAAVPSLHAGADEDWSALVALDAGPGGQPQTRAEAQQTARAFLARQETAIDAFLAKYPDDTRAPDARVRLAEVWATQGSVDNDPRKVDDAMKLLTDIAPLLPPARQADAAFLRVSLFMQSRRDDTSRQRDEIVRAARNFAATYPQDRRAARVLVEAATICDEVPSLKTDLLDQAERLTTEQPLLRRIADDRKRLSFLGQPLSLKLPATDVTPPSSIEAWRGRVVILVFWSGDSPHSLLWLRNFAASAGSLPNAKVITVCLDADQGSYRRVASDLPAGWLNICDGKGWESPLARSLGINALPTVWMIDKRGVVRSINARANYQTWIRLLARE